MLLTKLVTFSSLTLLVAILAAGTAHPKEIFVTIAKIEDNDPATDEQGSARTRINVAAFKRQAIVSSGGYQFVSYYGSDGRLIVARRKAGPSGWTNWSFKRTEFIPNEIGDPHNVSTIALDGDGYLHLAWGVHRNPLLYTRSTAPVLNDLPFSFTNDSIGNADFGGHGAEIPMHDQPITYPEFYRVPGSGDVLLSYRTGAAGNGEYQLVRWDDQSDVWVPVHVSGDGGAPWIDEDYSGDARPNANAYLNALAFDGRGRLLASWTWRSGKDSTTAFKDYQSNHDIMFAASAAPDQSSPPFTVWFDQQQRVYERDGRHAIDEGNAEVIVPLAEGSSLINAASMTVDRRGRPLIATWYAPSAGSGDHTRQYVLIWFDGAKWVRSQITRRLTENGGERVAERSLGDMPLSRPLVLVDDTDRVLVAFCDWQRGGRVTVAYSVDEERSEWAFIDLTNENAGLWEPSYDATRWNEQGILSMIYQRVGLGDWASSVAVLEWDARSYFSSGEFSR